jgi:peptide/nickel transport system ATP-binding protein/oligopeptide transport system ATP-binding protein
MLGVDDAGNPDPAAGPAQELHDQPGFADTWFDLKGRTATSS